MCGVNEAMMAMKVVKAVGDHNAQKAKVRATREANQATRRNAQIAYMYDLSKIEAERGATAREKAIADFQTKQQTKKLKSQALNLGFGNPVNVLRDIGAEGEIDIIANLNNFEGDIQTLHNQEYEAHSKLSQTYNQLNDGQMPSVLGLGLAIGGETGDYLNKPATDRKWFKKMGNQN